MTCENCGATLKADARFCGSCGTPVVAKAAESAAVTDGPVATAPPLVVPWTRKRKLTVAGVAAAAVLLVGAAALGIGFAVTSAANSVVADQQENASDDSDSGSENEPSDSGDDEISDPADASAEPETPVVAAVPVEFSSSSGNIRCHIDSDGLICRQGEVKYAVPSQNCSSLSGTTIGLKSDGVWWPCLSADFIPAQKLAYDTPVEAFGYTCSINYSTGVTCTNAAGSGFQMEYYSGVSTF